MFNFDYITKQDIKQNNINCLEIPNHPYTILVVGGFASGKICFNRLPTRY